MGNWTKFTIKTLDYGRVPVVKSAEFLRDGAIGELVETVDGKFYQIRRSLRGILCALEVA